MNTYTFVDGEISPLDILTEEQRTFIGQEYERAGKNIIVLSRRQLRKDYRYTYGELDRARGRFFPPRSVQEQMHSETPEDEMLFRKIMTDISSRIGIVGGTVGMHDVVDPSLKPKEWTGRAEDTGDVFSISKQSVDAKTPLYNLSRVQVYDLDDLGIPEQLEQQHESRGEILIDYYPFMTARSRAEAINANQIDKLIRFYGEDTRTLLAQTFGAGYNTRSKYAITPELRERVFAPFRSSLTPKEATEKKTVAGLAKRVFDRAAFTGLYYGAIDRKSDKRKANIPQDFDGLLKMILDTVEEQERAWQAGSSTGVRISTEYNRDALRELSAQCAKRADPTSKDIGRVIDQFLGLSTIGPKDRENLHKDLQIAAMGVRG